ncbi:molybdopterin molybdotransferase MoeA [Paraglaciecola aestuariivivens]
MLNYCDSPDLMPIDLALKAMFQQVNRLQQTEEVELDDALGRVLAKDVKANIQVPPADNSAMDGFALNAKQVQAGSNLELIGSALAGQPFTGQLEAGQCVRIMTGAVIPANANAVIMQENTQISDSSVTLTQDISLGENVRKAGEDIELDEVVVSAGTKLNAAYLALIASVGVSDISVVGKLKVGIIATGDELTPAGQPLKPGAIYESNRSALKALLAEHPVELFDFGIIADNKPQLNQVFEQAGNLCDLVISCGGVSVGEADYVKEILATQGKIDFWKVAIKPGKPFAFGQLKQAVFCGLPGNPVSTFVTFEQLVKPLIQHLTGQSYQPYSYFVAKTATKIKKRPGRADFQRGLYYRDESGQLWVSPKGKQGSGIMSSVAHANCYIVLELDSADIAAGSLVKIQPFKE